MTASARVTRLFHYPVKSLRGIELPAARIEATGIAFDRQWMVVDEAGRFLTQRTHPHMARIVPRIDGGVLTLSLAGFPDLTVRPGEGGEILEVTIWDDFCRAQSQGHSADEWLSRALGEPVRLARVTQDMGRRASYQYAQDVAAPIGFPDGFPLLVCNEASLADLNTRLPQPMPIERFRPNLVIAGLAPWDEDRIDRIVCGALALKLVKPCTRCSIPTFDHLSGEPAFNVLRVLKTFRFDAALHGVTFGENAVIERGVGTTLAAGTPCEVSFGS